MKFLMFIKHTGNPGQPPKGLMDAMEKFVGQSFAKGILKDTGGLVAAKTSTHIQSKGGKVTVKDGMCLGGETGRGVLANRPFSGPERGRCCAAWRVS